MTDHAIRLEMLNSVSIYTAERGLGQEAHSEAPPLSKNSYTQIFIDGQASFKATSQMQTYGQDTCERSVYYQNYK